MIKVFGHYELPFGKGHRLSDRPLDRFIGGWTTRAIMVWQSGAPFSILSGRGTLNRDVAVVLQHGEHALDEESARSGRQVSNDRESARPSSRHRPSTRPISPA